MAQATTQKKRSIAEQREVSPRQALTDDFNDPAKRPTLSPWITLKGGPRARGNLSPQDLKKARQILASYGL